MLKFITALLFAQVLLAVSVPADLTKSGSLVKRQEWHNPIRPIIDGVASNLNPNGLCAQYPEWCKSAQAIVYDTYEDHNEIIQGGR